MNDFRIAGDNLMHFLECLDCFLPTAQHEIDQTKIVYSFHTVSFDANSFQIVLPRKLEFEPLHEAVTFVYKCLRIVSVITVCKVRISLSRFDVVF
mmetsp:Transcript_16978/g.53010  ORF Transcript_16978/g.53010 Transcript_16978/m.53010 type:complete len:95 (-) Transcript_16978:1552-1836(-)